MQQSNSLVAIPKTTSLDTNIVFDGLQEEIEYWNHCVLKMGFSDRHMKIFSDTEEEYDEEYEEETEEEYEEYEEETEEEYEEDYKRWNHCATKLGLSERHMKPIPDTCEEYEDP
jgi:hypothetical protein